MRSQAAPAMDGLRKLADERGKEARVWQERAATMAKKHQAAHYVLGGLAAIALPISASTFFIESVPTVATVAGIVASVFVSLINFLGEKALAKLHWDRHDCLGALAQKYENAALGPEDPTVGRLDELADEWKSCTGTGRRDAAAAGV